MRRLLRSIAKDEESRHISTLENPTILDQLKQKFKKYEWIKKFNAVLKSKKIRNIFITALSPC